MADVSIIVGLSVLTSSLVVFAARTWISEKLKNSIKNEYDQKLETHKAQLRYESLKEIEQLKAQLQIAAAAQNVRYSRVFDETAATIADTYAKLIALRDSVINYTKAFEWADEPPREERRKEVSKRSVELYSTYYPRRLYLSKNLAHQTDVAIEKITRVAIDFMRKVEQPGAPESSKGKYNIDEWLKVEKVIQEEIPPIVEQLEDEFRKTFGLHESNL